MTDNPILARIGQVREEGLHPMFVRVQPHGRGRWLLTLTFDDMAHPDEMTEPLCSYPKQSELPPGVVGHFWERFPNDLSEIRGSEEAVETWMAEVARVGKAMDWARFDGGGDGYPAYLTKPAAWLRETNPYHPENPRNPAVKFPNFPARLAKLIADAGHASATAFADAAGIPQQTLQGYLTGKRRPTWDNVQRIAAALQVPTDVFRDL